MDSDNSVGEDLTSLSELDHEAELLRKANVNSLMKIAQLQAQIAQLRTKLAVKGKDIDAARRRVKSELSVGRRLGAGHMSQGALQDIISFIALLEEENRDLRELSTIPVEIEKLKAEVLQMNQRKQSCDHRFRDYLSPENTSGTQSLMGQISSEVAQLRGEIAEFKRKLTEESVARAHLQDIVVPSLEVSKAELEREIAHLRSELMTVKEKDEESLVSFKPNCKEQFSKEDPTPRILATVSPSGRTRMRGSMSVRMSSLLPGSKSRKSELSVYSPTFLRRPKSHKLPKSKTQQMMEDEPPDELDRGKASTPELASMGNYLVAK